jgi:uncharacterized protein
MHILWSLIAGLIFGAGLVISGMSNPAKVMNFLDLAGSWDPSLAFVMAGAVAVSFAGFRLLAGRSTPLSGAKFHVPTRSKIDPPLIMGSALFGIGWGLSGFCPGPALTALSSFAPGALVFLVTMVAGLTLGSRSLAGAGAKQATAAE